MNSTCGSGGSLRARRRRVRRLHRHAQAGARRRLAAGIAGAGADDLPAASGARQRVQRQPARDAGLAQQDQRQRRVGIQRQAFLGLPQQRFLVQRLAAPVAAPALADHHVQRVVVQQLVQLAGDADADVQLDLGMRQPEGGQHVGQGPQRQVVGGAQPHAAAQPGRVEQAFGPFVGVQDDARMHQQAAAVAGQRQRVGVAHEQPPVQRLLQLAHVFADGGLGQAQPPRGLGEAGRGGRGGEGLEPERIEHGGW